MGFSTDSTLRYYQRHADEYAQATAALALESLYAPFLALIPLGGAILDAGCGSGRDSLAFQQRGYDVTALDAAESMAAVAARRLGKPVQVRRLQELDDIARFDGIWACASVLHVPRGEVGDVLRRFHRALKPGGVCFLSFKEGEGERVDELGRRFTDFTMVSLAQLLASCDELQVAQIWTSDDPQGRPGVRWVNALWRRAA